MIALNIRDRPLSALAGPLWLGRLWLSFFPLEMKHYSADAFWALLLPALAAWASEGTNAAAARKRALVWWAVAAAAHWLSNGGLLAAPGSALVLFALIWRRFGPREAGIFAAAGLLHRHQARAALVNRARRGGTGGDGDIWMP